MPRSAATFPVPSVDPVSTMAAWSTMLNTLSRQRGRSRSSFLTIMPSPISGRRSMGASQKSDWPGRSSCRSSIAHWSFSWAQHSSTDCRQW